MLFPITRTPVCPIYNPLAPDPAPTQTDPSHPLADPTSARPRPISADHWSTGDFQCRFGQSPPISPPRDRAHMTSDRDRPSSHHRLRQPFQCRQFTVQFGFVIGSSFTLNVHPTGNLGESYIGIRQCPHLREIPENCPKMARDRFLIIVRRLIYIHNDICTCIPYYYYTTGMDRNGPRKSQGGSIIRVYIYTSVELHVLYSAAPLRLYTL